MVVFVLPLSGGGGAWCLAARRCPSGLAFRQQPGGPLGCQGAASLRPQLGALGWHEGIPGALGVPRRREGARHGRGSGFGRSSRRETGGAGPASPPRPFHLGSAALRTAAWCGGAERGAVPAAPCPWRRARGAVPGPGPVSPACGRAGRTHAARRGATLGGGAAGSSGRVRVDGGLDGGLHRATPARQGLCVCRNGGARPLAPTWLSGRALLGQTRQMSAHGGDRRGNGA